MELASIHRMSCFDQHKLSMLHYFNSNDTNDYDAELNVTSVAYDYYDEPAQSDEYETLADVIKVLQRIFVPIVCLFGILGNALTLLILTRKKLQKSCDGSERTVHMGLFSLCCSDLLVCICLLPHGLLAYSSFFESRHITFTIVYRVYGSALANTFILTSTWCTVNMAASRYMAIVHPIKTRPLVSPTGTKISYFLVFTICMAFNVPRFFMEKISRIVCPDGSERFYTEPSYFHKNEGARTVFMWVYFVVGIFIPLATLAVCNIGLVKALIKSARLRKQCRVPANHVKSNLRITSILVTIVVMYIALVSPAEILSFVTDRLMRKDGHASEPLTFASELTNILQTINFSCNFLIYFILNVQFRVALKEMFRPCTCRREPPKNERYRFRPFSRQKSDVSKYVETTQTKV